MRSYSPEPISSIPHCIKYSGRHCYTLAYAPNNSQVVEEIIERVRSNKKTHAVSSSFFSFLSSSLLLFPLLRYAYPFFLCQIISTNFPPIPRSSVVSFANEEDLDLFLFNHPNTTQGGVYVISKKTAGHVV